MDLYNIPHDNGVDFRLNKFVEYQHKVPPIGPTTYMAYAKSNKLTPNDCIVLAWYFSMTYCEITSIFMLNTLFSGITKHEAKNYWKNNKPYLQFVSARRYVKNMDWFIPLLGKFTVATKGYPFEWLSRISQANTPEDSYNQVYRELVSWKYMGRFSVELFTDAIVRMSREGMLKGLSFIGTGFEWKRGSNITSGMLNMFYMDKEADTYDKTTMLSSKSIEALNQNIKIVQREVKKAYPEQDTSISVITPKMCSWRNLFKGSRYGGYHHDRQLEQLIGYEKSYYNDENALYLFQELYELRKTIFDPVLLGELGGWTGIRKERKKLWITEGVTGVEAK